MKIIRFIVDGLRKLKAVELEIKEKGLTKIYGRNGQGKSSIIDFLDSTFTKKKFSSNIIQNGKDKIIGEIELTDFTIKRSETANSSRLEVVKKDGSKMPSPKTFINGFINELTFNPMPFLNLTTKKKLKFMMDLFSINFDEINKELEELEFERKMVKRDIKKIGTIIEYNKIEPVSMEDLLYKKKEIEENNKILNRNWSTEKDIEIKEIVTFNRLQNDRREAIERNKDIVENHEAKIESLKSKIRELEQSIRTAKKEARTMEKPKPKREIEATIPEPEYNSTKEIDEKIANASEHNLAAERYKTFIDEKENLNDLMEDEKIFDQNIKSLREKKKKMLAEIDTGIEGLEIKEDDIYHNGISSENWCNSKGLMISTQLCIIQKPELEAVFIDNGEALDKKTLEEYEKILVKNNIQCIITKVIDEIPAELDENIIYIEEGEIVKNKG